MSYLEIIILAIIQGITEFLPISSSAHLILPNVLLGWKNDMAFDVAVHVGSLLAVMVYFRQEIIDLLLAWTKSLNTKHRCENSKLAWLLIYATLPAVVIGFLGKAFFEHYGRDAFVIACSTIVFGLLLWYADKTAKQQKQLSTLNLKGALVIGFAQVLAMIPGTSRSGITMTAGLMIGLTREAAAKFSFLLSIPTILGAGLLATKDLVEQPQPVDWNTLLMGSALSFVSAYLCIYLFLSWISRIGMTPFVIYRLLLGSALLLYVYLT